LPGFTRTVGDALILRWNGSARVGR